MDIINFGHPVTDEQAGQAASLLGERIARVLHVPTQFDAHRPFAEQIDELLRDQPVRDYQWQTEQFCVNLPSFAPIAAVLLARLHGLCGHFPAVLVMRASTERLSAYDVAEVINLQALRDGARHPMAQRPLAAP